MSLAKSVAFIVGVSFVTYHSVDDKTRTKFDYGMEEQLIVLKDLKNNSYLFWWEFFGAHDDEIAAQKALDQKEIAHRNKVLREKRDLLEGRTPAYDDSHKWDKFVK